ncbi:hypothetical protein I553_6663 [Mycobacterium xenopi 4042]|uniref:Uncharacterized protein n=1 Tax=Mycobacterium xenopi 4042 TaxID=1299334 RepID=X7ZYJ2_MYCXE|nr:hypothetical protein I553_6663 [Mycobacterium xenopi 4042]
MVRAVAWAVWDAQLDAAHIRIQAADEQAGTHSSAGHCSAG